MKKKLFIIILTVAGISFSSCKKKFLDIAPQEFFSSTIAVSTLDGLTKTVTGGFNQMLSGNLYGGGIVANSELLADFMSADPISDYSLNQFRTRQLDANNSQSGGMWSDAYRAIYISNVVLQNLPNFESQNPGQCQLLRGECFFIRGAMHFELLRMFAQPSGYTSDDSHLGICIETTPGSTTSGQNVPRSTVAQCYQQIEADLDSAASLLPTTATGQAFVTQGAAQAFLMRVYFTQHNYAKALYYVNLVKQQGYKLTPFYGKVDSVEGATASTTETIFQLVSSLSSSPPLYANNVLIGRLKWAIFQPAQCYMSPFFNSYIESDSAGGSTRISQYKFKHDGNTGPQYYVCYKYSDPNMNMTVLRYAEVLLTSAECIVQTGGSAASARADLNLVRQRAGLQPDNSTNDPGALLAEIRTERDVELSCEGDRFFEIKRRQINFTSPESGEQFAWNSPQLVYPIPLQEVLENKAMKQNPGY